MTEPSAQATPPPRPPGGPDHLLRPDGRLQVGVGPGSWLVEGWGPAGTPGTDLSTAVVRGLLRVDDAPGRGPHRRWTVQGEDALAASVRRRLRASPVVGASEAGGGAAEGVVLVSPYLVPVGTARRPGLVGRCVLPVVAQTTRVVVGPWCGMPTGPCLHCLDLHRRDQDAQWPALAALLDDPVTGLSPPAHPEHLVEVVSAVVVLLVGAWALDERVDAGVGYEFGVRAPHVVTRRWSVHPACGWHGQGGR